LFSLDGNDRFLELQSEEPAKFIKIRIVGGTGKDTIISKNSFKSGKKIWFYDNKDKNNVGINLDFKDKRSNNPKDSIHKQNYKFKYDYSTPLLFPEYNVDDGLFLGLGFQYKKFAFRKEPYSFVQKIGFNIATRTSAVNIKYNSDYRQVWKNWNLSVNAGLLGPKYVVNFFGFGNNTQFSGSNITYYRVKFMQFVIDPYIYKNITEKVKVRFGPEYKYVKVIETPERYISSGNTGLSPKTFSGNNFFSLKAGLSYSNIFNVLIPKTGYVANFEMSGTNQFGSSVSFININSDVSLFYTLPRLSFLTFATRVGGAHNFGNYYFYQANTLGGTTNLRGYRRTRFYGRSSVYNNNDLRVKLFRLNTYLIPFEGGVFGFFDQGRVWADNESSSAWHTGYGPGVWFLFYKRLLVSGCLGYSPHEKTVVNFTSGFSF
jgi:hypothetical protein